MTFNPFTLDGKQILVTGASSGIGKATSIILSKLGARVVLLARNEDRLIETLNSLDGTGHSVYVFDLTDTDNIPAIVKKIAHEQGPLHGIFHSAGIDLTLSIMAVKSKHIDSVFRSSVIAALMLARGICQSGVRGQDAFSLVIMSSIAGFTGIRGHTVYSASKAAVDGAVRSMACELSVKGIRVNSIVAGAVQTAMIEKIEESYPEKGVTELRNKHLLGFGSPDDIGFAAAYLLSDASRWVTGTCMVVDGGYLVNGQ